MSGLNVKNVSMVYDLPRGGSVDALKDVSFDLEPGELLTILGPSGCGKTTLLNILAGFLAPTDGDIVFEGNEVLGPDPQRGMVFQQGALFEWLTVAENVGFGPKMSNKPSNEIKELTQRWLDIVGLSDFGEKSTYELSGGMQQRVALARCLANEPDLILMDEPLGALDALTREKMQGLILKLWKDTGKTIVLITHSVEEAMILGNRLFIMAPRPGRLEKEYKLPFAEMGLSGNTRDIKKQLDFVETREEILTMIWDMEEEIMGRQGEE